MVKTTRKSIGPFCLLLITGSSGTSNLSCPLNSNTIFFPPFLNLNHMKSSYLSFLVWKQSSPWKELLSGMFLLMSIIKIIIIIKKNQVLHLLYTACCVNGYYLSFPCNGSSSPLFPSQSNSLSHACCCPSGECRGGMRWDYCFSAIGEKTCKVRRQHSVEKGKATWLIELTFFSFGEEGGIDGIEGRWLLLGRAVSLPM